MSVTLESPATTRPLQRLALDITRACQAQCTHCYNQSGPQGTAGEMTREDWLSLLDQAAALGVRQVQLIGGEPTLHPDLSDLITRAVDHGIAVEVFTNLIHVRAALWPVLRQRGVTLATSYYSDQPEEHEAITQQRGSYRRTKANIARALLYRIPVRAAIVHVREGQHADEAAAQLREMGVTNIRTDRLREIGRGADTDDTHQLTELCGQCARGRAAVLPNGEVAGCVMSGSMLTAGNARTTPLAQIVTSPQWAALTAAIPQPLAGAHDACTPDSCTPNEDSCQPSPGNIPFGELAYTVTACGPDQDGSDCAPAEQEACGPSY
ncbi:radical SAM protein [Streptomyces sp. H10-C2]|uniref:radical SAM/SPASM domain-containing protein n=1 Tax=unclassified Streptomyces TaxID=2593676 RepID=UPI0024B8C813|nr:MULTISPECIES: radical SAM protein [unclassified Streptomyces]MDJ0347353.1 radical SAM protein [Streptomyces sp. PH10-H1]MDJ0375563.1 radical SAM protein [Streptomyces sp. H10-C2]